MNVKPKPPSNLNKEHTRVWIGWCSIGDREVAREAAAKGIYIALALKFIGIRKEWDESDVDRWFRTEILSWVYQLVEQKQIYKASHVLQNIGIQPSEQLSILLTETCNKNIRNYIAEHLEKNDNLNIDIYNNWKFIQCIELNNDTFNVCDDISQISIKKFELKNLEWKENTASILFFNTYDCCLLPFLTPKSSWFVLLRQEKLDILKIWIHIYFSQNFEIKHNFPPDIFEKLKTLFLNWSIDEFMLNIKNYSKIVQDFIQMELSKFGIFLDTEKEDIQKIVSRFSQTENIQNIIEILKNPNASLSVQEFYEKFTNFCIENEYYELLNICPIEFNLVKDKKLLLWTQKNTKLSEEVMLKNINTALCYFSDNYQEYFQENPLILFAIILFSNFSFCDIFNNQEFTYENVKINNENIVNYFSKLPVFKNIILKHTSKIKSVNLYDLLSNNLKELFNFRKENFENYPNFADKSLCEKFGYKEKIDYIFYLKLARPSQAYKLFILEQFEKKGELNELSIQGANNFIYELILQNYLNNEILISCLSFLEMLACDTSKIRTIINVINSLKENVFLFKSSNEILSELEQKILGENHNFINILKEYELVINFAKHSNLKLPEKYLLTCTQNNNWLEFLIFTQKFEYPLDQCLILVQNFENKSLIEHIYHALQSEINDDLYTSVSSISSFDDFEKLTFPLKSNFLKILIKCHKSQDPPTNLLEAAKVYRYPLFCILATCYEPDSVVINWLLWLSISTNIDINLEHSVSPEIVSEFLKKVLLEKYLKTLLTSFFIFMNENALYFLIKFIYNCVYLNFNNSMEYLQQFEKLLNNLNYNTQLIENDYEYTYLSNSYWLLNTALKLIFATLNCFNNKNNQIKFLNYLCTTDFAKNIPIEYPNFCTLSTLLKNISSNFQIDLSMFLNKNSRQEEIIKCIEHLVTKKEYTDALHLAKYENICKEYILIQQWTEKFNSKNSSFFEDSNSAFEMAEITPHSAAEFYVYCCTELSENSEKYTALKYAYNWLKKSEYNDEFTEKVEQEIWLNYFTLSDDILQQSHYDTCDDMYLWAEILKRSEVTTEVEFELNENQKKHFYETLQKILESGDFVQVLRLEKMFQLKHSETEILKTCFELSEGLLKPYEISTEQRLLFLNRDMNLKSIALRRRPVKSFRTSIGSTDSIQSMICNINDNDDSLNDTLTLLESMSDRLKHGHKIANKILMTYRLSINLNISYQDIVNCKDSNDLLLNLQQCNNKLEVIHDIILIFKWDKKQITDYILQELKSSICYSVHNNLETIYMWDLELDTQFHLILQLCPETNSSLGKQLVAMATVQETEDETEIQIIVELLIRAHDCYNSFCNMEGIALILRKSQNLILKLVNLKNYKLMVRLLTGIGRYTEMNYIFQILKENDQFEFLLKRNYKQDNKLKIALLKFIKKHCPKNQNLYRMVALHFSLFSEVADLWEQESREMTTNLIEIAKLEDQNQGRNETEITLLKNNESTLKCLNNIMNNYSLAAEYHIHGEKMNSALNAARKAELIALQIFLTRNVSHNKSSNCILDLSNKQILQLVSNDLSYPHSKILIESYNFQIDWGSVLFKQLIINANSEYFEDYLNDKPLSNTLAQDLTRRFLAEKTLAPSSVNAMKNILKHLDSVHMKYRLASELGFSDVVETLLNGSQLAYLKDTVWKKGYKQL